MVSVSPIVSAKNQNLHGYFTHAKKKKRKEKSASFHRRVKGNLPVYVRRLSARGMFRHSRFSLVARVPRAPVYVCVRACVRARSWVSFFSLIPQRTIHHGRVLFLTGGSPQRRSFFPSLAFHPFSPVFLFFPVSFFLQVHPLSPVPLSHRCPIHSPQTGVATCSKLFHLIRGHKLLPRSLYTATEKREERGRELKRESRASFFFRVP